MKIISEAKSMLLFCFVCFICNILYRVLGAGDGGIIAMMVLCFSIIGIGGLVNAMYILVEFQVPPET